MLFPGAAVVASDLDTFMTGLEGRKDQLPVVTGELADGWIYGAPSATTNRRLSPSRPIRLNQSPYYQAIVALTIHMGLGLCARHRKRSDQTAADAGARTSEGSMDGEWSRRNTPDGSRKVHSHVDEELRAREPTNPLISTCRGRPWRCIARLTLGWWTTDLGNSQRSRVGRGAHYWLGQRSLSLCEVGATKPIRGSGTGL